MDPKETKREKRAQAADELGRLIRRHAHVKWSTVRTAERKARGHHVWRFRNGPETSDRFLHVSFAALEQADNPGRLLFDQLRAGRWLDRLDEGPETALRLSTGGQLQSWPAQQ